jgi:hypothetical protein
MSLRIYLACPFPRAYDLARPYMNRLREAGHTITRDWVEAGEAARKANPEADLRGEVGLSLDVQRELARGDLEGVQTADVFWALATDLGGTGMWIELGYAQALAEERACRQGRLYAPQIVVSGPPRTIFTSLPGQKTFADHDEALAFILSLKP